MDPKYLGFKIVKYIDLQDWRTVKINEKVSLISWLFCPSDNSQLKTIVTFVGNDGSSKIRVGCCVRCGYIGYMDRPTQEWINEYYLNNWVSLSSDDIDKQIKRRKEKVAVTSKANKEIFSILSGLNIDKNRYICEIGCGYGEALSDIRKLGFDNLVGVENSRNRAIIANRAYNLKIFTSAFESMETQNELRKLSPFGLIFSYHVLEHTYDPSEIIGLVSRLQNIGDYIVISVPNAEYEVSMISLAFIPHLHSFTFDSLSTLLNKYGYLVVDNLSKIDSAITVVARRDYAQKVEVEKNVDYFDNALKRFSKGLGLNMINFSSSRRLWWSRKSDIGGQVMMCKNEYLEKINWAIVSRILKYNLRRKKVSKNVIHSAAVESLSKRYTSYEESPIEIQFDGDIRLLFK